jgi:hypothetical protein
MSALVEEKTMVEGGILKSDLSDNLRLRAYASFGMFLRIRRTLNLSVN